MWSRMNRAQNCLPRLLYWRAPNRAKEDVEKVMARERQRPNQSPKPTDPECFAPGGADHDDESPIDCAQAMLGQSISSAPSLPAFPITILKTLAGRRF